MRVLELINADWPEAERRLIAEYRANGKLLNVADGGDEPFCSKELRVALGNRLKSKLQLNPALKKMQHMRRAIANGLKNGHVANATREKLRLCAQKAPEIFGDWAAIPDRLEIA